MTTPFDAAFYFPQWHGSPNPQAIRQGSRFLYRHFSPGLDLTALPIDETTSRPVNSIWNYPAILNNLKTARDNFRRLRPRSLFMLAGDCSADVPAIDWLHSQYPGSLGVVWIDAHSDIHIPETSASRYFHGMPVRTLLGEGDRAILATLEAPLKSSQILFAGIRSIDPPEQAFLTERKLPAISAADINRGRFELFSQWIKHSRISHLHIHLDLDALDPADGVSVTYRIENGIRLKALREFLNFMHARGLTVGFTLTEYAPDAHRPDEIDKIAELISPVMPLRKVLAA